MAHVREHFDRPWFDAADGHEDSATDALGEKPVLDPALVRMLPARLPQCQGDDRQQHQFCAEPSPRQRRKENAQRGASDCCRGQRINELASAVKPLLTLFCEDRSLCVVRKKATVHYFSDASRHTAGSLWLLEVVMVEIPRIGDPLLGRDGLAVEPVNALERGGIEAVVDVAVQYLKPISPNADNGA